MSAKRVVRTVLALLVSLTLSRRSSAACQTQWLDLGGKGQNTCLTIDEGKSLSFYKRHAPEWDPCEYKEGRCIGASSTRHLRWTPLAAAAVVAVTPAGRLRGTMVYRIVYAPAYEVYAWKRADGLLQPVLLISGDETIVARIFEPERFRWRTTDLLHVRILITGTGHLQESVFLAQLGDQVVSLIPSHDALFAQLHGRGLQLFHKGGGFCKDTLTYAAAVEDENQGTRTGGLLAQYALRSGTIALEKLRVYSADDTGPTTNNCETEP